jgi:ABC-type glycerol-3-phosphate transport system permease component
MLHAQETTGLYFVDETGQLDQATIEASAQPLLDVGAAVAVYAVTQGNTARMNALLQEDGLIVNGALQPNLIALFVSTSDEFSFVRFGSQWAPVLGSQAAVIRTQDLALGLAQNQPDQAMLGALTRISGLIGGTVEMVDRDQLLAADYTPLRTGILVLVGMLGITYLVAARYFGFKNTTISMGIYIVLTALAIYSILPFVWMLSSSLKPLSEVFAQPPALLSPNMSLSAFQFLIDDGIAHNVLNTFVLATLFTTVTLFFATLAGYGFSKFDFPGRKNLFRLLLAIMLVPGAVTMIPTYFIMLRLGWVDTLLPLVVPGAANAYAIFFMRQYIRAVPDELLDAARIDGCSEFDVFWRVVVPIVAPGMISLGLISFMAMWNNYLGPLIYLRSPENWTLPLYQMNLTTYISNGRPWPEWMAVGVISVVPTLLIYILFQRRFTEGIAAGAVKT